MTKDIVCGKSIDENLSIKTTYGDRPYYFCSRKCEGEFVGNPLKFTNPSGAAASTAGSPKITASGQEVRSKA
jgi:YHS domain-containing protein